jgi:hypothetical protein
MSNVTRLSTGSSPEAPANSLCNNDHPVDTISAARQVVMFLEDAVSNQLREDDPKSGAEGVSSCLMMVADALAFAQEQVNARICSCPPRPASRSEGRAFYGVSPRRNAERQPARMERSTLV